YAPMIRRFADHLLARSGTGLWPDRSWGDWLAPGYAVGPEGMAPIGTAMEVAVLRQTAEILREIGDAETSRYDHAANAIAEAYHEAYFDTDLGCYRVTGVAYRQSLNILPLAFGMVPPQDVAAVRASLIADLEQRTDGHLDCGAIAVRHLLPVLADAGRDDLALTVLMQRSRPGWGAWFNDGESTLLESWDPDARSRNHYFLGSVASWIQQRVGGLRLTSPGWASFAIEPVADDRVTSARIRHRTPHGDAMVEWERGPGGWNFTVLVPDGSTATLAVEEVRTRLPQGTHCLFVPLGASTVAR
ncbi:MAG: hypothetical protein FWF16_12930, partial [Microbacteriaceae bacterium]|nr:hypothetical protein [Microbacteriaceae bacterium]